MGKSEILLFTGFVTVLGCQLFTVYCQYKDIKVLNRAIRESEMRIAALKN